MLSGISAGRAQITKSVSGSSNLINASAGSPVSSFTSRFGVERCSSFNNLGMNRYDAVTEQNILQIPESVPTPLSSSVSSFA